MWRRMFELLAPDADNEYAIVGSTIVRAHGIVPASKKTVQVKRSAAAKAG